MAQYINQIKCFSESEIMITNLYLVIIKGND